LSTISKCFLLLTALAIFVALLFCILSVYRLPDANEVLTRAGIAQLPKSTQNLKVEMCRATENGRAVFNEAWLFIRFVADQNDIDRFISDSPGIDKRRSRALSTASYSNDNPPW